MCALCVRELLWHTNSIRKPTPTINKFLKNETHRTARALFLIYFSSLQFFFANNNFFAFVFMVVVIAVTDVVVVAALHVENYCTKTMRYSDSLTWL